MTDANLFNSLNLLTEDLSARLAEPELGTMDNAQFGLYDALVDIAGLLNRAMAIAAQPHVRPALEQMSVTDPASKRLQAILQANGHEPEQKPRAPRKPRTAREKIPAALRERGPMTSRDLARYMSMSRANVTLVVGKLLREGVIEVAGSDRGHHGGRVAAVYGVVNGNGAE